MAVLTTVMDLLGLLLIVAGVYLLCMPAALMVAGVGLLAMSWGLSRAPVKRAAK